MSQAHKRFELDAADTEMSRAFVYTRRAAVFSIIAVETKEMHCCTAEPS